MFTWGSNSPEDEVLATESTPAPSAETAGAVVAGASPETDVTLPAPAPEASASPRLVAGLEDMVPRRAAGQGTGRVALPDDDGLAVSPGEAGAEPTVPGQTLHAPETVQLLDASPPSEESTVSDAAGPALAETAEPVSEPVPNAAFLDSPTMVVPAQPAPASACPEYALHDLLNVMVDNHATDLHLNVGSPPTYRIRGALSRVSGPTLTREMARQLLLPLLRPEQMERFKQAGTHDFAYEIPEVARFRVHYFGQHHGLAASFRRLSVGPPNLDDVDLPEHLKNLCSLASGLVIATGPARSGKSTTLAAMVDHINHNRCEHVVTLESPIEHVHDSDTCLIDHREIGVHTNSLADGFKAILHEQPDVVVMGDLEDQESASLALRATEAGILVFATMRSASTAEALDRLLGFFPLAEQDRTRALLAVSLKSVLGHWMIRFGSRMLLAMEVLHVNKAVARAIREGRLDDLTEIERQGGEEGMQTFEQAVAVLVKARKLDKTVARRYTLAR